MVVPCSATDWSGSINCGGAAIPAACVGMPCSSFVSEVDTMLDEGTGGNGGSRYAAGGGDSTVSTGSTSGPGGPTFSVVTFSFDDLVIADDFAAGFFSEYSGPPMPSSLASLDSPVVDSPALAFGFTTGVGCLPDFGCNILVFFAGTA